MKRHHPIEEYILAALLVVAIAVWIVTMLGTPAPAYSASRPPSRPTPAPALEITTVETIYEGTVRVSFSDGAMLLVHLPRLTSPSPQAGPATREPQRCERHTDCKTRFTDYRGIAFVGS